MDDTESTVEAIPYLRDALGVALRLIRDANPGASREAALLTLRLYVARALNSVEAGTAVEAEG